MPRFVVLQHELPVQPTHWDFMLEQDGVLRTWALETEPTANRNIMARALPDHRIAYLTYEGPISGERGTVRRWDSGKYELSNDTGDGLLAQLVGERLQGTAALRRASESDQRWIFRFSG